MEKSWLLQKAIHSIQSMGRVMQGWWNYLKWNFPLNFHISATRKILQLLKSTQFHMMGLFMSFSSILRKYTKKRSSSASHWIYMIIRYIYGSSSSSIYLPINIVRRELDKYTWGCDDETTFNRLMWVCIWRYNEYETKSKTLPRQWRCCSYHDDENSIFQQFSN